MTMLPALGAEEAGSSIGLTTGQKASAASRALPRPKTNHPYVVGLVLTTIGGFAIIGSITGTLPSMLAALFVPNALIDSSGAQAAPSVSSDLAAIGSQPVPLPGTSQGTKSANAYTNLANRIANSTIIQDMANPLRSTFGLG